MEKYKVGLANLIPVYGLDKFAKENPGPKIGGTWEAKKYAAIALPIATYHLACIVGAGMVVAGAVMGGLKGLEALVK